MEPLKTASVAQELLSDGFTVPRAGAVHTHVAVCEAWTNLDGWELRLIVDGLDEIVRALLAA